MDRHKLDGAELSVDAADQLVDYCAKVLVFLDILARRNGNLDENDLANPLRVLSKKNLESMQLLRHTLDVVQTVDTDNELDALELLLECCNALLNLGLLKALIELLRVDTDGECANGDDLALELNTIRCGSETPALVSLCS